MVNVLNLKAGGLGNLGDAQLAWLADDLKHKPKSTPIVVFAHVPLWTVYPEWGWGTDDGARALALLKKTLRSVTDNLTVPNPEPCKGRDSNITFHTAMSTAFPQPKPGAAPSPGPMKVPAIYFRTFLGLKRRDLCAG